MIVKNSGLIKTSVNSKCRMNCWSLHSWEQSLFLFWKVNTLWFIIHKSYNNGRDCCSKVFSLNLWRNILIQGCLQRHIAKAIIRVWRKQHILKENVKLQRTAAIIDFMMPSREHATDAQWRLGQLIAVALMIASIEEWNLFKIFPSIGFIIFTVISLLQISKLI